MINFEKQFSNLLDYNPTTDSRLRTLRTQAFERFIKTGLPTKKWEEWQFTDFSVLNKEKFRITKDIDLPSIPKKIPAKLSNCYLLFFINGHYQSQLSQLPDEIVISSGNDYLNSNPEAFLIDNQLLQWTSKTNPFLALNTSMMNSGLPISIAKNATIDKPLQIIYLTTKTTDKLMNHPRFDIHIGTNSNATIIEHYIGETETAYFTNAVTQITLEDNACLDHVRIQEEYEKSHHVGFTNYNLKADALLRSNFISSGSLVCRNDINLNLNAKGADTSINGLCVAKKNQHHDQNVVVNHSSSACQSDQLFKYILSDSASGVFNGKVIVDENTHSTNANQSNKNLLLSPSAIMNSNPQLEIYAEDVKCSHGSTTGQIDIEALFYLQSRGLSKAKANQLIMKGFVSDIVEKIQQTEAKSYVDFLITKQIENFLLS